MHRIFLTTFPLRSKENMFVDGSCQQISMLSNRGWRTQEADDWIYYPQQSGNPILLKK